MEIFPPKGGSGSGGLGGKGVGGGPRGFSFFHWLVIWQSAGRSGRRHKQRRLSPAAGRRDDGSGQTEVFITSQLSASEFTQVPRGGPYTWMRPPENKQTFFQEL